jgi:hypothetical protein
MAPASSFVNYTKLDELECENKSENIFIFFENETIDFNYQKLGFIELKRSVNSETAIKLMKLKSHEMCGNALINFKIDKTSNVESDADQNISTIIETTYSAICVKIDENSDFLKNNKKEIDNSFLNIHNEINEKAEKASSRRAVAALIYISLIVVLLYQISPVETTE